MASRPIPTMPWTTVADGEFDDEGEGGEQEGGRARRAGGFRAKRKKQNHS